MSKPFYGFSLSCFLAVSMSITLLLLCLRAIGKAQQEQCDDE